MRHGQGERGTRWSALWGKGSKRAAAFAVLASCLALVAPWGAEAGPKGTDKGSATADLYVPAPLLAQAQSNPQATFNVIVQGDGADGASAVAQKVAHAAAHADKHLADAVAKADDALARAQKAASDAAAKAAAPNASPKDVQAEAAAQAALAQAQAADDAAQAAVSQLAGTIDQQQVSGEFSAIHGVAA